MQMATHFLTGILIAKLIDLLPTNFPVALQIIIVCILAYFSHYLLDCIAISTYHPLETHWDDKFYKIYHILFVFVFSFILLIIFFIPYWWVMIFAVLPDIIDWYTLRPLFHKDPIIHPFIDKIRDKVFSWLPDLKEKKWAALIEFTLIGALGVGIIFL